jgi:limonene-1,2-epoxide hydrolase
MPDLRTDTVTGTSQNPIQVVESFLEAMRAKDIPRGLALMSEDVVYQNVPFPPHHGRASVERVLGFMARIPGEIGIQIHNIAERSGTVLTERTDSARARFIDLEFWVCGTFEVLDGKIVLWRDHFDLGQVALQLVTSPLRALVRARPRHSGQ